jgi:hypothetical protein
MGRYGPEVFAGRRLHLRQPPVRLKRIELLEYRRAGFREEEPAAVVPRVPGGLADKRGQKFVWSLLGGETL